MSDFVFVKRNRPSGLLGKQLQGIYHEDPPEVCELHGGWGSLAVSRSVYFGFAPVETEKQLCVIIGGPVLTFTDNRFIGGTDATFGTRLLLTRWNSPPGINWDEDVSGPFVALRLDKVSGELEVVTDPLSYVSLFHSELPNDVVIGTHTDVVAKAAGCDKVYDLVSIADFILNGIVTYPFTFYSAVKQLSPASVHRWNISNEPVTFQSRPYWQPLEDNPYRTIDDAAECLREGVHGYVNAVTEAVPKVGTFVSGGEDTRVVLAMIPKRCARDAVIFLDQMNWEGQVARAVATANGATFKAFCRDEIRYLRVLPECSDLVGTGSDYVHVHSYGLHRNAELKEYRAVFGGFSADALLKGAYIKKIPVFQRLPFLPLIKIGDQRKRNTQDYALVSNHILHEIKDRAEAHEKVIGHFRTSASVHEWFELWPASMRIAMPYFHGNRRLFASYEPFMAACVTKIAAAVPQEWKMNRRLFRRMALPLLTSTRHLPHAQGWLPYYPWYINMFFHGAVWACRGFKKRAGWIKGNQGPWADWKGISSSTAWRDAVNNYSAFGSLPEGIFTVSARALLNREQLGVRQKVRLMQVLYQMSNHAVQEPLMFKDAARSLRQKAVSVDPNFGGEV